MGETEALRERREAVVRERMESENRHEFDVTMGTFDHPRYEIVATGDVYDRADEVAEYFRTSRAAFPGALLFEPGGEGIVCERIYFAQATIGQQLLGDAAGA